jgi:hypothetical protein
MTGAPSDRKTINTAAVQQQWGFVIGLRYTRSMRINIVLWPVLVVIAYLACRIFFASGLVR